jgi:type IV pilus assembly protein PilW
VGSAFANSANDPGTVASAPADRRLRLQTSFTIHLRNEQNL